MTDITATVPAREPGTAAPPGAVPATRGVGRDGARNVALVVLDTVRKHYFDEHDLDERLYPEDRDVPGLPARQKLRVNDVRGWLS